MPLIKDGRIVEDAWLEVGEGEALPAEGAKLLVTLARWRGEKEVLLARGGGLGLRLEAEEALELESEDLAAFDLIALNFPKFTDGRAYSAARLIRGRYGFKGELRAVGQVQVDQLRFMWRCGFDAFVFPESFGEAAACAAWRKARDHYSVRYQPGLDGGETVLEARHGAGAGPA